MYNYRRKVICYIAAIVIIMISLNINVYAAALTSIRINEQLPTNGTIRLTVTGVYDDGTTSPITSGIAWESSNTNVAIVDSNGNVAFTGRGGSVTITATYNGLSTNVSVNSQQAPSASTYITINGLPNYCDKGATYYLTVQAVYSDNSTEVINNRYVTFTSSDPTIATVNSEGMVIVHGYVGGFLITAKYRDKIIACGSFIKTDGMVPSYYYYMSNGEMTGIKIIGDLPKEPFQPRKLAVKSTNTDGYYRDLSGTITWSSSNRSVVDVQSDGTISFGGQCGTAVITAKYDKYEATVTINIDKGQQVYEEQRKAAMAKDYIYDKQRQYFDQGIIDTNEVTANLEKLYIASQTANVKGFKDTTSHWAAREISLAKELGIVTGAADNTFKPDSKITRAEFAAMLCKAFSVRTFLEGENAVFKDVAGKWYQDDVMALTSSGIMSGYSDKTFRPNNSITRGEMIAGVSRLIAKEGIQYMDSANRYTDIGKYKGKADVDKLYTMGALSKIGTSKLEPSKSATKAEAVSIIMKLYEYVNRNSR